MNNEQINMIDIINILSYLLQSENIKKDDEFLHYIKREINLLHEENQKIISLLKEIKNGR